MQDGKVTVKNKYGQWENDKFKKNDGQYAANEFVVSKGKTYYMGDGKKQTGWQEKMDKFIILTKRCYADRLEGERHRKDLLKNKMEVWQSAGRRLRTINTILIKDGKAVTGKAADWHEEM